MKRDVPLSDKSRKVLEKQLSRLIDQSEWVPDRDAAQRALAILNLIEVLEADDLCRGSIARIESSRSGELECELKMARDRISELEDTEHLMKKYKLIGGFALLFLFLLFVGLFVYLI